MILWKTMMILVKWSSEYRNNILKLELIILKSFFTRASSLILTDDTQLEANGMWNMENFEYKTYHYERCRQLCLTDPVHTIILKKYVESQVHKLH